MVEPDEAVYDRIDPYWIDFELILVQHARKWKWRMWADHGVELFIHPAMQESDYQTVAIARLQEILDAIGVKTAVILSPQRLP